jgi:hypothetical protein
MVRSKGLNPGSLPVALHSFTLKCHIEGHEITTTQMEQQIYKWEVFGKFLESIFRSQDRLFNDGKLMLCEDSGMHQWYSVICACMADYFENDQINTIKQHYGLILEAPKSSVWAESSLSLQLKDHWLHFKKMILVTQWNQLEIQEARKYLDNQAVGTSEGI